VLQHVYLYCLQLEVIEESRGMVPDTEQRLATAVAELQGLLVRALFLTPGTSTAYFRLGVC
jgi:hypothetical protein